MPHAVAGSLKNQVACDVLWSDPVNDPGIKVNEARGCGTIFGPDVTAEFLSANGLKLIIRSHEGPDARDKRLEGDKMPPVDSGYAEDHVTDSECPCAGLPASCTCPGVVSCSCLGPCVYEVTAEHVLRRSS